MCEYNLRVNGNIVVSIEEVRERGMEMVWSETNGKHMFQTTVNGNLVGGATIESHIATNMTKLIVVDKKGTPIDGYAQSSRNLEDEKKYAKKSLRDKLEI